jgi:hypothetical protein
MIFVCLINLYYFVSKNFFVIYDGDLEFIIVVIPSYFDTSFNENTFCKIQFINSILYLSIFIIISQLN